MNFFKTDRIYLYEGVEDVYLDCFAVADPRQGLRDGMLVIPGGAYSFVCMDREGERTALAYAARGVNVFVLNYRCAKGDNYPMHLECAVLAMKWIREHAEEYFTNPERIFASGFSAGGHLCGTLATKHKLIEEKLGLPENIARPTGIVMCYPVVTAGEFANRGSFSSLLGKPYEEITEEEKTFHSIECNVTRDTPPAFIWHTSEDNAVPVQNSLMLGMAYANAGVGFTLHIYPYGPHGIALATDYSVGADRNPQCVQPLAEAWLEDSIKWMKTVK